ncbi:hypothetical protein C8J56DRAFT_797456 [Mycena floridula]|nr:hypothetical protein C8J56DRAFT_797456 [Mycena floridula]
MSPETFEQNPEPETNPSLETTPSPVSSAPSSPATSSTSLPSSKAIWVIWSRRPQDPSLAPAIIFAPSSKPPPNIVAQALDLPIPPAPVSFALVEEQQSSSEWSQSNSTVPSSSVTENTDTPTIPGSPVSSNTSASLETPAQDKETSLPIPEESAPDLSVETAAVSEESAPEVPVESTADVSAESWTAYESSTAPEAVTESPPVEPVAAASASPTPPKKSWASLLRTGGPAAPSTSSTKNSLPTSSVVGFSIPASSALSSTSVSSGLTNGDSSTLGLTPAKRATLLALLTNPVSNIMIPKIRPRGLINTGNMCFANSVLQILIYCPPFYTLFYELAKLLPPKKLGPGKDGQKPPVSLTPLVDATIEFLKDLMVSESENGKMTLKDNIGFASRGKGKGKEKEEDAQEADDWDDSFIPTHVYDAMKEKKRFDTMRGGHQEDAEEFLGFYLDTLEEELLSIVSSLSPPSRAAAKPTAVEEKEEDAPPPDDGWLEVGKRNRSVITRTVKTIESPITRIFGGKFRSTLRAPQQKDSVIVEDWRSLQLDIQRDQVHTVQDALSYISHPQPVQMTHSTRPGVTVDASQQVLIDALPPILVLHMKRFCYDTSVGGVVKVGKQVSFGPELEIPLEIMAPNAKKSQPGSARYKLFGAVYHHGVSASGGHYTLDVLHPTRFVGTTINNNNARTIREGWIRIDDELVSDVASADDVFGGSSDPESSRCAYLLFYRRIR